MYFFTKERAMYLYPDGIAAIAAQHRDELIDDARRWHLARTARRGRRHGATRRASGSHDSGAAHHRADLDGCAAAAGASRHGQLAVGGAGRQGGAGTPAAAEQRARLDGNADRARRAARWARLDRDEAMLSRSARAEAMRAREAQFVGRTTALAAIAAMSVQQPLAVIAAMSVRQSNLAPCGAREAGRVR